jgi:Caspase domain
MTRLPDPQHSYAVLIGTGTYRSTELADLPAIANNLDAFRQAVTDPALGGFATTRCAVLWDPVDTRTVYRSLRQYAKATEDTLLVYFAGHGCTGPRNELYLGLSETDSSELSVSALPFGLLRDIFIESPAANRVLILDCCFSGRAIQDMSGTEEAILGQVAIEGTYTLASTPANAVALAPTGATYTAFTGELLAILRNGIPGGPPLLTFDAIYRRLRHVMMTHGLPIPAQRGTGTIELLALSRNQAPSSTDQHERSDGAPGAHLDQDPDTTTHAPEPDHHPDAWRSGGHFQWRRGPHGLELRESAVSRVFLVALLLCVGAAGVILGLSGFRMSFDGYWNLAAIIAGALGTNTVALIPKVWRQRTRITINSTGIAKESGNRSVRLLWTDLAEVTFRSLPKGGDSLHLVAVPTRDTTSPGRARTPGEWTEHEFVVVDAKSLGFSLDDVRAALTEHSGGRFH